MRHLEKHWYHESPTFLTAALIPLSLFFRSLVALRYIFYKFQIKKTVQFPVPVIVVGNITVGGTGKTPFVIWLATYLQQQGYKPGIVTRGVGGKRTQVSPYQVDAQSEPAIAGDEAILLAKRTTCPVVICKNRAAAVTLLLEKTNCNIVISDDGLQHYRLSRHIEIAMIDNQRKLGNGYMLPAGPLREPKKRLKKVDLIVQCGSQEMRLEGDVLISVADANCKVKLEQFANKKVHAIAGIGNPEKFFATLKDHNIPFIPHVFPDHFRYRAQDICFGDDLPVLMTEKDAVKCQTNPTKNYWYLPITAAVDQKLGEKILDLIKSSRPFQK